MTDKKCPLIQNTKMRSTCPIANTLDIIGDKWTLLIVRDMLYLGKCQFSEFVGGKEGVSTNILTDRLKKLEQLNVITKKAYQKNPTRYEYELTSIGNALKPLLNEMVIWGEVYVENTYTPTLEEIEKYRQKILENRNKNSL